MRIPSLRLGTSWVLCGYFDAEVGQWWEMNTHHTDATEGHVLPSHWMPLPAAAIRKED